MNGAQSLIRTLVGGGVDVCFANPGTSEMHFVASLDAVPEMRAVLALFEGVVTGAADAYGRMAERPAATLLHLGLRQSHRRTVRLNRQAHQHDRRQTRRRVTVPDTSDLVSADGMRICAPPSRPIRAQGRVLGELLCLCRAPGARCSHGVN